MKYIGIALGLLMVIICTSMTIMASGDKTNRKNEADVALDVAIDNTLDNLMYDKVYDIENVDVFIADFIEDLLLQINSDSTVTITIKGADIERGLLSVDVTMNYTYSNGNSGSVTCERTIIFERSVL